MSKYLQIALGLAALVVASSVAFTCWRLSVALDAWGAGGAQAFAALNQTLEKINRPGPCGSTSKPCGTLAEIDQSIHEADTALVHLDLVARHEQQQLGTYDGYAAQLVSHLNGTLDSTQRAADSISGTAQNASVALGTVNDTVRGLQPLERSLTATADASTATINTFNGRLSDPKIDALLNDFRDMSDTSRHMLITADAVETKATFSYLHPSTNPWKRTWDAVSPFLVAGAKITANVF